MQRLALIVLAAAGAVVVAGAITSRLYRIPTSAMEPTLHCAEPNIGCRGDRPDRIAVSRIAYRIRDPRRGDIVAYELPRAGAVRCGARAGSTFVHRIVAIPGDEIATARGALTVNGVRAAGAAGRRFSRGRLGPDRYFVIGDNEQFSCDSRVFGPVGRGAIVGPKIATYWPPDRISVSIG